MIQLYRYLLQSSVIFFVMLHVSASRWFLFTTKQVPHTAARGSFGRLYQGIEGHVHDLLVTAYTSLLPLTLLRD